MLLKKKILQWILNNYVNLQTVKCTKQKLNFTKTQVLSVVAVTIHNNVLFHLTNDDFAIFKIQKK